MDKDAGVKGGAVRRRLGGHGRGGWTLLFLHSHSSSVAACMPLSPCALWFCRSPLDFPLAYSIMARVRAHSPCPLCSARPPVCPWLCRTDAETVYSLLLLGPLLWLEENRFFKGGWSWCPEVNSWETTGCPWGSPGLETGHALICPGCRVRTSWRAQARRKPRPPFPASCTESRVVPGPFHAERCVSSWDRVTHVPREESACLRPPSQRRACTRGPSVTADGCVCLLSFAARIQITFSLLAFLSFLSSCSLSHNHLVALTK